MAEQTEKEQEATPPRAARKARRSTRRRVIPVLTLRETLIFPLTSFPLTVGRDHSLRALDEAQRAGRQIVLLAQKEGDVEDPGPDDLYPIGTLARIRHVTQGIEGTQQVWVQGTERIQAVEIVREDDYLTARVQVLPEDEEEKAETSALARSALQLFERVVAVSPFLPDELVNRAINQKHPLNLLYLVASSLRLTVQERVSLLEISGLREKYERLVGLLEREIELLELGQKLRGEIQDRVEKSQREFFLREQIRAIQKELGESDPQQAEVRELRDKVAAASLTEEALREANRELDRLERLPPGSPEHSLIRTYLDWLLLMPWGVYTRGALDVARAEGILDEDHYGLEKVKERIVEYLAVKKLRDERGIGDHTREPILCLVGPPGVGKTSLGQSVARAMERAFARMSLGGVHDEAEIRGHRRTYVGALPGRVAQTLSRAGAMDPVFMLDEIDKVGADWRGDPSSALLEVLDQEQNKDFRDHYLDVPVDLSHVMFIATANTLETIQPALRDRMEVLEIAGYTEDEKVGIAERFLLPKQVRAHGLNPDEVDLTENAMRTLIRDYTREAGVRTLEREIGTVIRKSAREIADGHETRVVVDAARVRRYMGRPRFYAEVAERIDRAGVATGLVVTPAGGDIVFVEASVLPGKKELRLTGQLGDVMRESAEAAVSFLRARGDRLSITPDFFETHDIHVHVPGGAVPKDGPSAGITIAAALASAITGRLVRDDLAMTGEISLRGKVLPIGGVKEKALGAHRAGLRQMVLPKRNEGDLDDLPHELKKEMTFTLVDSVDDVLDLVLRDADADRPTRAPTRAKSKPAKIAAAGR